MLVYLFFQFIKINILPNTDVIGGIKKREFFLYMNVDKAFKSSVVVFISAYTSAY